MILKSITIICLILLQFKAQASYDDYDCRALKRTSDSWESRQRVNQKISVEANNEIRTMSDALDEAQATYESSLESLNIIKGQIKAWMYIAESNPKFEELVKKFQVLIISLDKNIPDILNEISELKEELEHEKDNLNPAVYNDLIRSLESHKKLVEKLEQDQSVHTDQLNLLTFLSELNERNIKAELQIAILDEEKTKLERRSIALERKIKRLEEQKKALQQKISYSKSGKRHASSKTNELREKINRRCRPSGFQTIKAYNGPGFPHL